ncbi:Fanconi anemia group F protein [Discoglossus pictus]
MAGKMASMLGNLDHFVEVLTLSRSVQVKDWDVLSVRRALEWATYFQHVYKRFEANTVIRKAIEDHLKEKNQDLKSCVKNYQWIRFEDLGKGEEILCMGLLKNKYISKDVLGYLITGGGHDSKLHCLNNIISQKAATQLLCTFPSGDQDILEDAILITQAEMLRNTLETRIKTSEEDKMDVGDVLLRIPQPQLYHILALVLDLEDSAISKVLSDLVIDWLLEDDHLWSGFCSNLDSQVLSRLGSRYPNVGKAYLDFLTKCGANMELDIADGSWVGSSSSMTFNKLLDHFRCLLEGPEDLKTSTETTLNTLKSQDGDYDVPGLSIWSDILLKLKET